MDIAIRKGRLHSYLETADDKKINAIYTMVENEIIQSKVEYTEDFKAELDRRYEAYKKDPSTAISAKESKRRIQKILTVAGK